MKPLAQQVALVHNQMGNVSRRHLKNIRMQALFCLVNDKELIDRRLLNDLLFAIGPGDYDSIHRIRCAKSKRYWQLYL